jgi:uncharacterized membrane protein
MVGEMVFTATLVAAALSCTLVAGLLLAFAILVMPGLKALDDGGFVRGFRAIDRVVQDRQPVFVLVWVGSLVSVAAAAVMGWTHLEGPWRLALVGVAVAHLGGVHLPTMLVNVPLNDRLQALPVESTDADGIRAARQEFEDRWNRWNVRRTAVAVLAALALIVIASMARAGG